ncbi:uncharacterized protein LOC128892478 [Hylaeus anthracinus]|uniref:uncharacterized protein LOC128881171 n=1 Tax=Hylaeus volcanicus TaxID=313075 RepID=UPI0023B87604|nr:uncharacterized protein LOC128881171 [Hylaeus volcanicus]XP_054008896.1 uncharacterized protein LOC128892478 [Hylaeus anthracinus]
MARKRRKVARKISRRKAGKVKPMKIAALIVSAIQDLRETRGSTPNKIIGYISYASNMAEGRVKRQVKAALRRGVEYGILRRNRGHYFLPTGDELDRANRVALRFAKLPLPPSYSTKSNTIPSRKIAPLGCRGNSTRFTAKSRKTKQYRQHRSTLISPTVSLVETIYKNGVL